MNVGEAKALFREYVDDPDANFVTDAQLIKYLELGLDEWRNKIRQVAPHLLMETTMFQSDANATNYASQVAATKPFRWALDLNNAAFVYVDLAGVKQTGGFMGPYVSGGANHQGPAEMLMDVYMLNTSDPSRRIRCRAVADMATFMNSAYSYNYAMNKYVLQFRGDFPDEFLLEWFPRKSTNVSADANLLVGGKLDIWNELIVLSATKRYMIKDGVGNQLLLAEYARQLEMFDQYLVQSFNNRSQSRVSVEYLF